MSLSPFDRVASVLWQSTLALGSSWSDLRRRFLSMFPQRVSPHYPILVHYDAKPCNPTMFPQHVSPDYPLLVHFYTVLCFPHMSHHTIHYWCTKMQHLITLLCFPNMSHHTFNYWCTMQHFLTILCFPVPNTSRHTAAITDYHQGKREALTHKCW